MYRRKLRYPGGDGGRQELFRPPDRLVALQAVGEHRGVGREGGRSHEVVPFARPLESGPQVHATRRHR